MYMSAIFKTDSGIFGHLEASDVTVTGQIKIGNHSVATENFVNQTVISGADYSLEINYLSGQADTISGDLVSLSSTVDTATGNIDEISGAVDAILNAEIADDTAFNTISGDLVSLSSTVDTATGNIDEISGAVDAILNAEIADDTAFNTISGDLVSLSSTVDTATGNLYGFFDKDENLLSNVSGNFLKLTFGSHGVPETSSSPGVVGQIAYSQSHIYICTKQNTWRRCPVGDF